MALAMATAANVDTAGIRNCSVLSGGVQSYLATAYVGVRDLVARGYSIPGRMSQRGVGSGSGVPCRTLSDRDSGQSPVMPHRDGFWHCYSNFWNRPHPLAQNFDTI